MPTQHQTDALYMVDYWLGKEWEDISDDNPACLLFVLMLQDKSCMRIGIDEQSFLNAARFADGLTETD